MPAETIKLSKKQIDEINERIVIVCKNDTSHVRGLSKN